MGFIEDGKWRSRYYSRVWYGGHFLALHFKVKRCWATYRELERSSHPMQIRWILDWGILKSNPRQRFIGKGPCNRNLHPCSASCRASVLYEIASARSANSLEPPREGWATYRELERSSHPMQIRWILDWGILKSNPRRFTVHKSKNLCLGLDLSIPQSSIHLICIGCELLL
jgi:hypothetical protein